MTRWKQRKGLCRTGEDKKMWSNSVFYTFSSKAKTSETAKTHKKLVETASRGQGACNRTGKPSVTFCERGGKV